MSESVGYLILEPNSAAQQYKCWGHFTSRFLTPTQQAEAPEASTTAIEGRKQQGIKIERLHQEPEKICHDAVVTEDHRSLAGNLDRRKWKEKKGHKVNYSEGLVSERRCSGDKRRERCRTGKFAPQEFLNMAENLSSSTSHLTVERVQWFVSSLENSVASFMNTATAFRMNVMKSWMWMKFLAQRSLLLKDQVTCNKSAAAVLRFTLIISPVQVMPCKNCSPA